jgi:hypothetical protein
LIFQLAQSFGTDAPAVGKVKQAADKIWTLKIEKRAAVNPAAEVETEWKDETTLRHRDGEPQSGLLGVQHEVFGGRIMMCAGYGRPGLGKYEAVFRENEIDETVLPNLTAEDLKDLGVSALGHRRKLLDAIAALRSTPR